MAPAQAPKQIEPKDLSDYFEVITRAVFQSGISWEVIDKKWGGFRKAFAGFDPEQVANFSPKDVDRLVQDTSIVRNRRKIEATVQNAETIVALDREHDGFGTFLRSHGGFEQTVRTSRSGSSSWARRGATTSCTWWGKRFPLTRSGPGPGVSIRRPAARQRSGSYRSRNFSAISICTTFPSCTISRIVPNWIRRSTSIT